MDWLRRNWPDVLIGVVFLAVVIAIIFTLLNGGFNLPFGGKQGSTSTPPSLSTPVTPDGTTVTDPRATTPDSTTTPDTPSTGVTVLPPDGTGTVIGTPIDTPGDTDAGGESTAPGDTPPAATTPEVPATDEPATTTPTTPTTPAPTEPVSTAVTGQSGEVSYRVSVGAFGNRENAERLAIEVQGENYPVFLAEQGSLTIVLVGPYSTEEQARAIAQQLASGPLSIEQPTVYRYEPDESPTAASSSSSSAATTPPPAASTTPEPASEPASETTTTTPPAEQPAASGDRTRFLQTGAFNTRESTLPQRETLESLGFVVSERDEDGFIKLLVGPFTPDEVEGARTRLQGAGIESFPR